MEDYTEHCFIASISVLGLGNFAGNVRFMVFYNPLFLFQFLNSITVFFQKIIKLVN